MTVDEFIVKLSATRDEWWLDSNGEIRCDRGCPVTAVSTSFRSARSWRRAANEIGLGLELAEAITFAADDVRPTDPCLRQRLLSATVSR